MLKKAEKYIALALSCMLTAACNSDDALSIPDNQGKTPIELTAGVLNDSPAIHRAVTRSVTTTNENAAKPFASGTSVYLVLKSEKDNAGAVYTRTIGYLQGFVAQKRDIESEQIAKEMQDRAKRYAEHALERTMEEYSVVTGKQSSFSIKSEQYAYMLLPVWLLTYKALDGAKYYFAMNGQTGEIHGRLPVDMVKLSAFAGALGGSLFVIVLALLYFLM